MTPTHVLTREHMVFWDPARHEYSGGSRHEVGDRVILPIGARITPTEGELRSIADRLKPNTATVEMVTPDPEPEVIKSAPKELFNLHDALADVEGDWAKIPFAELKEFANDLDVQSKSRKGIIAALKLVVA